MSNNQPKKKCKFSRDFFKFRITAVTVVMEATVMGVSAMAATDLDLEDLVSDMAVDMGKKFLLAT